MEGGGYNRLALQMLMHRARQMRRSNEQHRVGHEGGDAEHSMHADRDAPVRRDPREPDNREPGASDYHRARPGEQLEDDDDG